MNTEMSKILTPPRTPSQGTLRFGMYDEYSSSSLLILQITYEHNINDIIRPRWRRKRNRWMRKDERKYLSFS